MRECGGEEVCGVCGVAGCERWGVCEGMRECGGGGVVGWCGVVCEGMRE